MGNSWSEQVVAITVLIYNALKRKIGVYLYGEWTQGPPGLTNTEIEEFESQFESLATPWKRRYGHRLDPIVHDRFKLVFPGAESESTDLETIVKPRNKPDVDPPIIPFDQLGLNCNTVNAVAFLVQWFMFSETEGPYIPSRLFLYYAARSSTEFDYQMRMVDQGVSFSDVFSVINLCVPVPDELEWMYNVKHVNTKPTSGKDPLDIPFVAVQLNPALLNLVTCLKTNGPFTAAVSVTKEFELNAKYTYDANDLVEGYQPLVFIDFSEDKQTFTAVNSFGNNWGDHGKVTLHVADLFKDPVFTSSIYTLVPVQTDSDEEKSD